MASIPSNFEDHEDRSRRKKRRRIESVNQDQSNDENNHQMRWISAAEQHTYSSKLLEALREVRRRKSTAIATSGSRAVREAADKVLAIAARGRTRWSRAILANRMKLRLKTHKKAKIRSNFPPPAPVNGSTSRWSETEKQQRLPPLEKRLKLLGRLVPGCRKLSYPNILDEATDYIAALQMQVRAMAALADILTAGSSSGSAESSSSNPVHMS